MNVEEKNAAPVLPPSEAKFMFSCPQAENPTTIFVSATGEGEQKSILTGCGTVTTISF